MNLGQFEHVVAAAAEVTDEEELVVIGSQAILGCVGEPPQSLLRSMEADVYPLRDPSGADLIDGALGDGSPFQRTFGFYAHGVGPETATAPDGWRERLVGHRIPPRPGSRRNVVAWCLEPHDLVLAKCAAGRDRDWEFASEALKADIVQADTLLARVVQLPISAQARTHVETALRAIVAGTWLPRRE